MTRRIGILSLPYDTNYGGVAQTVALSRFLTDLGHETVLLTRRRALTPTQAILLPLLAHIPFQNVGGIRARERARALLRRSIDRNVTHVSPALRSRAAIEKAVRDYRLDAVIVGSDQVWRLEYLPPGSHAEFFLDFVADPHVRKIAYAASFGVGTWMYPDRTEEIVRLLADFDAVSVREESGVDICRETFGRADARHVLDPTLLVPPSFYRDLIGPPAPKHGKRALCYLLDRPPVCSTIIEALGPGYDVSHIRSSDGDAVDLAGWLRAFRDADFVITDSFHGTVFSIVFGKPFISILNHGRGGDRFRSLLKMFDLSDRLIESDQTAGIEAIVAREIDFDAVQAKLDRMRAFSAQFLTDALSRSPDGRPGDDDAR